jgi:hypothetical protein
MENKAIEKPRTSWPTLFDGGLMEKFFNAPLDEFFVWKSDECSCSKC